MAGTTTGVGATPLDLSHGIEVLELKTTPRGLLKRADINTLADLIARTKADLLDIRHFGQKYLDHVEEKLAGIGLGLKKA